MIDKEKIRVGLRFTNYGCDYNVVKIDNNSDRIVVENLKTSERTPIVIKTITDYCDETIPETPEQKGKRETDYADKVIQDIEQFELDNIEYLRDKIQEKIDRIR